VEKIPEVLGSTFVLQEMYPERKEFHIAEAVSFTTFMALYQDTLGYTSASKAWLDLASAIEPEHSEVKKVRSLTRWNLKQKLLRRSVQHQHHGGKEHFPPSMLLIFASPEQDLIDFLTPLLPVPCTLQPRTAEHLQRQGLAIHPKTPMLITGVLDGGYEGGVVCDLGAHKKNGEENVVVI
jgi:hypothetical protein